MESKVNKEKKTVPATYLLPGETGNVIIKVIFADKFRSKTQYVLKNTNLWQTLEGLHWEIKESKFYIISEPLVMVRWPR